MFESSIQAVPPEGASICAALRVLDRLTAQVVAAIGAFDASGGWALDGCTSMTAWLRTQGDRSAQDAARLAREAARLRSLPVVAAAYESGELSGGHVAVITRAVSASTVDRFADHEAELVPTLASLSVHDTS